MTVTRKMLILVLSALVGLVGLTSFGQRQISQVYAVTNFTNVVSVPTIVALDSAYSTLTWIRTGSYQHLLSTDPNKMSGLEQRIKLARTVVDQELKKLEQSSVTEQDRQLLAADRAALAEYDTFREKVLALSNSGQKDEAREMLLAGQTASAKVDDAFEEHRQHNVESGQRSAGQATKTLDHAVQLFWIIMALTLMAVAGIGWYITR